MKTKALGEGAFFGSSGGVTSYNGKSPFDFYGQNKSNYYGNHSTKKPFQTHRNGHGLPKLGFGNRLGNNRFNRYFKGGKYSNKNYKYDGHR